MEIFQVQCQGSYILRLFQDKPHKAAKVDVWDSAATKNALDDAIKKVVLIQINL